MTASRRTVAVTGAQGYIGSALVAALLADGIRVLRVSSRPLPPMENAPALQGAIDDPDLWRRIVAEAGTIFHLAGNTSVYAAADDPAASLRSTLLPVTLLTAAARETKRRPRVVFASTVTLYGLGDRSPRGETTPPQPATNYDLHKLFAEQQLALASAQGLINAVSLRLANVFGPSSAASSAGDRGILNQLAKAALAGKPLSAFGGGNYLRDYVYIDDVVRAFIVAGCDESVNGRSFNVASGCGTSVADAFRLVAAEAGLVTNNVVPVEAAPWPAGADPIEFREFVGDVAAIRQALGWSAEISLAKGVARLVAATARSVGLVQ